MSIRHDGQAYRRGVVFGFTVAEIVLLLVFCLLLLFMPVLLSEAAKRSTATASQSAGAANTPQSHSSSDPKSASPSSPLGAPDRSFGQQPRNAQTPLPEDWKVLVPDGIGSGRVPHAAIWFRGSANFCSKGGEVNLTTWQLRQVQSAIEQLEEARFAEGERTMSEAERPDHYERAGYVAKEPIERQRLVDQLTAVVAAA